MNETQNKLVNEPASTKQRRGNNRTDKIRLIRAQEAVEKAIPNLDGEPELKSKAEELCQAIVDALVEKLRTHQSN